MNLTVIARKEDELAAMKAQVESLGVRFLGIQASNTDFGAIAAAFETSWQTYGRLDLLVNAAGTGVMTPFEELTKSDVDTTIDVNLKGTRWTHSFDTDAMLPVDTLADIVELIVTSPEKVLFKQLQVLPTVEIDNF